MILLTNLYERFHVRERHVTKAVHKWFDSEVPNYMLDSFKTINVVIFMSKT